MTVTARWPDGARTAVVVTVDVDGDLPLLAADPDAGGREKSRSVGTYGTAQGAERLHAVLRDLNLVATWFLPGGVTHRHPDLARSLAAQGQRLASHGGRHLDFDRLDLAAQVREIGEGRRAIREATGVETTGFRVPAGEWDPAFPGAIAGAGFRWSSSLPGDDLPFPLGEGLWELPFRYDLEDLQYLGFNLDPPFPPGGSRITPLAQVEESWWLEYLGAVRYRTLYLLRLNAEVMGTPGRCRMLGRFLRRIAGSGEAWFATCDEVHELAVTGGVERGDRPYSEYLECVRAERRERQGLGDAPEGGGR